MFDKTPAWNSKQCGRTSTDIINSGGVLQCPGTNKGCVSDGPIQKLKDQDI